MSTSATPRPEHWEFDAQGCPQRRIASINDLPIGEDQRTPGADGAGSLTTAVATLEFASDGRWV